MGELLQLTINSWFTKCPGCNRKSPEVVHVDDLEPTLRRTGWREVGRWLVCPACVALALLEE